MPRSAVFLLTEPFGLWTKACLKRSPFSGACAVYGALTALIFMSLLRVSCAFTQRKIISVNVELVTKLTLICYDKHVILHETTICKYAMLYLPYRTWLHMKRTKDDKPQQT